ncbi:MAG: TetR/AcrR family transcriptional regulator [Nannocystaceae bacterium]
MPPRPRATNAGEPPTAKGQRTRQRLVDAAELIFGDIGFERASIVEITRGAGVALGTFYVYFPTKQAIFAELVGELGHGLRRALAEATAGLRDRLAIERAGCHAFLSYALAHRGLYRIVRQAEFVDPELYREYYRRLAESYTAGLTQAMDEGKLRRLDPEIIAYALMGIFDFLGMRWVIWEGRRPPDRLVDDVFVMIRGGLAPALAEARPDEPATRRSEAKTPSTTSATKASSGAAAKGAVRATAKAPARAAAKAPARAAAKTPARANPKPAASATPKPAKARARATPKPAKAPATKPAAKKASARSTSKPASRREPASPAKTPKAPKAGARIPSATDPASTPAKLRRAR